MWCAHLQLLIPSQVVLAAHCSCNCNVGYKESSKSKECSKNKEYSLDSGVAAMNLAVFD